MKKAFYLLSFCTMLLLLSTFSVSAQTVDVSGKWNMNVETSAGNGTPIFVLKQTGEMVTGTYTGRFGEAEVKGTLKEKEIKLELVAGEYTIVYTGSVDGNTMKGIVSIGDTAQGTFSGIKEAK